MNRYLNFSLSSCLASLCCLSTAGARAQDSAAPAALVRSNLEPTTAVVAHANLQELESASAWAKQYVPVLPPGLPGIVETLYKQHRDALAAAGVKDIYASLALQDVGQGGVVFYLPASDPKAAAAVAEQFITGLDASDFQAVTKSKLVVIANRKTLERQILKTGKAAPLPASLEACFDHVVAQPVAVGVTVSKAVRVEVSELWPQKLPLNLPIVLSPKQLMLDSQHIALSLANKPEPKLTLHVRSDSSVANSGDRNAKFLELVATGLEPYAGKLQLARADSGIQLVADRPSLEACLKLAAGSASTQAAAMSVSNQMKQIMLAVHNFAAAYQYMPPRETRSADDKRLLSWRVHILPYLGAQELYSQFHLDEPWDSSHNLKLAKQMPEVYRIAGDGTAEGKTRFVLPMIEGSAWNGNGPPVKFEDITDGTSATVAIYVAPASHAVVWTKPDEPTLTKEKLIELIFGGDKSTIAGLFDGSVHSFDKDIDPAKLLALITHQGGEVVNPN